MKIRLLSFLIFSCLLFLGVKKAEAATTLTETTIASTPDPLYKGQTHIALMAFSLTSTNAGTTTFTTIGFTGSQKITNYFAGATIYLYTNTANNNDFTTASSISTGAITGGPGTALGFTFPTESIARNDVKYYWVVVDFTGTAGAIPGTFQLTMNTNGINSNAGTENYNDRTGTNYNMVAGSLIQDQTTGGLTANPLNTTQTNVVLSGVSLQSNGTSTLTGISYTASQRISNYFTGTASLYSSTSSTWLGTTDPSSTLLQSKAIPTNTTALPFTFTSQTINNGVTMYYYIVLSNYSPPATSTTFEFDVNAVTSPTNTITTYNDKTGSPFNLNAPSLSENQTTGGLAANPLVVPQTNVAISGVALTATGTTTLTGISYTATRNMSTYFTGNASLYSSTSSTWLGTTDPSSTLLQTKAMPANTALAFTFPTQTINNGVTVYYYVILDNYSPPAATITFGLNVNLVTGTTTTYVNKTGTVYNLVATSLSQDQTTGGLAANPLVVPQTNVAISGVALTATGNTTLTGISYTATRNMSTYFTGNASLYSSTSSTWLGTTDPSSTLLQTKAMPVNTALAFTFPTQTINNGVTVYYYVILDNYNPPAATITFGLNVNAVTGTPTTYVNKTGTVYNLVASSLAQASVTGGLASTTLTTSQNDIAIDGVALTSTGNNTFTSIKFTSTPTGGNISPNFTSVSLYSSISSSFPGVGSATLLQTITSLAANSVTFSGLSETINNGVTNYYYLVVNYNQPASNASFQFNSPTITGATLTGTAAGQTYTLTAPTLTEASVTGGLAANPITGNQTNLAILGMSLSANSGTASFTGLTFNAVTNPTGGVNNTFFSGNVTLYSSTSNSFPGISDPSMTAISTKAVPNTAAITFTVPTQTIANGTTMYYYVVMDANIPPAVSTTYQLNLGSVAGPNTVGSASGPNYTLTSAVTFGTASTAGFAVNPLNYSQTGIALLGFSINTTVSKTFSQFNLTYALSNGTFTTDFTNFKLYVNTTGNTFAGATQVTGAIFTPGTNTLRITGISQTIPTTTYSYFIVADFHDPANAATIQLSAASAVATTTYSYGAPIAGNTYNCGPATNNWVGGSGGNDWNVPANWSYGVVPLPADHVQLGVSVNFAPANSPIISTPVTIASIDAASNNASAAISLTVNNTLTVNGDITDSSDGNSGGSQTLNLKGTGTINATDIVVHDDFNFNFNFTVSINSSVTTLNVSQNISLTTAAFIVFAESAAFNLTGGTATVGGIFKSANAEFSLIPSISTISVSNATLILTNAAAISGLDGDNNNAVNFNNPGSTVQYSGAAQLIYTDAAITGLSTGPSYRNLIIAGTGAKTLTPGGNLNIAGDFTNSLANDVNNYVTLTNNPVYFNGTSAQSLNGGIGTGTIFNNVNCTNNSTKTMSTGPFTVINTGTLYVGTNSSNSVLAVSTNSSLTLVSDGTSTATVNRIYGSVTGNVNVQRFVTGGAPYRGYRLFSSPVNINGLTNQSGTAAATYEGFVDPTYLNGGMLTGGPGSGFRLVNANPLSYLYDDTRASNAFHFYSGKNVGIYSIAGAPAYTVTVYNPDGSVVPTPIKVPVGNSFLVYYAGTTALSNPAPESTVVTATGTLNQGTVNIWLFNTNPATVTRTLTKVNANSTLGLNQIGNPYASTIQLSSFYTDNSGSILPTVYLLDPTTGISGTYIGYNASTQTTSLSNRASNYVVSGQGFWVQAKTGVTTPTVAFLESEKVAYPAITSATTSSGSPSTGGTLLMDIPPTTASNNDITAGSFAQNTAAAPVTDPVAALVGLHLQLSKDSATSIAYTQTGIYFRSDWTDTFNANDDAIDRDGATPKVYLSSYSSDAQRLCINQLADYSKGKRIKLYAGATTSGVYYISLADIANIDTINYNIFLVDHKINDSLDMVKYKAYAFNIATTDTTTYGANRFTLVIERHALPPYSLLSFSGLKVNNAIQLNWKTLNEGTYTGFALQKLGGSNTYASIYTTQGTGLGLYTYVDTRPLNGNNTYRLQQTDIDGRVTYSMPVTITYNGNSPNGTLTVYPNPAKSIINVSLNTTGPGSSNYIVDIYNISGTIIDHKTVNTNNWTQDVSNYKLGVYVIEIKTSNGYLVGKTKFVKIIN